MEQQAMMLNLQLLELAAEWRDVSTSDTAYAELFVEVWARDLDFLIVEHDVLPWPGACEELWACSNVWCGFNTTLMCTKFSPTALGECPVTPDTHWTMVDKLFWHYQERDVPFCEHKPEVINLNRRNVP
jgi:hypothetical protein